MAARRLLIVMLILLGISTLAAALVPQRTLKDETTTTGSTTTQPQTTTAAAPPGRNLTIPISVGMKKPPQDVSGPLCLTENKRKCIPPLRVGDQVTLLVYSKPGAQLDLPEFGQFQFAAPNSPARFELLLTTPGPYGIRFAATGRVAARFEVLTAKAAKRQEAETRKGASSRARGGSGRP